MRVVEVVQMVLKPALVVSQVCTGQLRRIQ
jgi:hypothetical protein